jgi:hypothetical protein
MDDVARLHQLKAEAAAVRAQAEAMKEDNPRWSNPLGPRGARTLLERAEKLEAEAAELERRIGTPTTPDEPPAT